jgi:hypothetical protein
VIHGTICAKNYRFKKAKKLQYAKYMTTTCRFVTLSSIRANMIAIPCDTTLKRKVREAIRKFSKFRVEN